MEDFIQRSKTGNDIRTILVLDINSNVLNDEFEFETALRVLPIDWRARIMNKKNETDRMKALCNRLLQLVGCSIISNVSIKSLQFDSIENGKPIIVSQDDNNITFSMTNGENYIAMFLRRTMNHPAPHVGIDLASEKDLKDPKDLELFKDIFNTEEYDALESTSIDEVQSLFAYYWSFKESYTKYTGTGLSCDLKKIGAGKLQNFDSFKGINRLVESKSMEFYSLWLNGPFKEILTICEEDLSARYITPIVYRLTLNDILSYL
ncbi:similar to Saccharomyces cerevisiae YGL154C LYS5 Phosphopantetheinyl transferase involved in lysine biosynthesis [Maudiozyma barnettii]|uniref:holo-[acyl-carrier-protein] synthase n=1 Tax=Maudiozyma barnettii TaxID=61262 RepID=A0A8H2VFD8_9SACH|nr:holo-[acyl-carrier-protein] synthase [Kazachstania barnettii]CAB4254517.1 similar to Saccharomyces cerevisiae YGL154C LYS5 Phosphopantetheinyl transferase involved in lysine biosynthesis [Kazachstania barnettii]CAD1782545.1 similar to Saccharomyces cerevisiae YGL154C LYS5 Phosphopantetheinyl transferase involved in lysine biosynthesis [Kazachstania barnettii]